MRTLIIPFKELREREWDLLSGNGLRFMLRAKLRVAGFDLTQPVLQFTQYETENGFQGAFVYQQEEDTCP